MGAPRHLVAPYGSFFLHRSFFGGKMFPFGVAMPETYVPSRSCSPCSGREEPDRREICCVLLLFPCSRYCTLANSVVVDVVAAVVVQRLCRHTCEPPSSADGCQCRSCGGKTRSS